MISFNTQSFISNSENMVCSYYLTIGKTWGLNDQRPDSKLILVKKEGEDFHWLEFVFLSPIPFPAPKWMNLRADEIVATLKMSKVSLTSANQKLMQRGKTNKEKLLVCSLCIT